MTDGNTFQVRRKEKFATIPTALVRDPNVDPYAIAAYVALDARTLGNDTEVWPSWSLLGAESHQSLGRLSKSLRWLEEHGWISVERRYDTDGHRKVNKYTLYWAPHALIPPDEIRPDSTSEEPDSTSLTLSGRGEEDPSEEDPQKKTHIKRTRPRDFLWEAFIEVHGEPATDNERDKFNAIVKKLKQADVAAEEYPSLVAAFTTKWNGLQVSPATVAGRVGELRHFLQRGPIVSAGIDDVLEQRQAAVLLAQQETDDYRLGGTR